MILIYNITSRRKIKINDNEELVLFLKEHGGVILKHNVTKN